MKKINIIVCVALLLVASTVFNGYQAEAYYPDKPMNISVTFNNDTRTEKNFTWITRNLSDKRPVVVVQEAAGGRERVYTGTSETVTGRRSYLSDPAQFNGVSNFITFKVNKVTVTGLKPDTKYTYYCGDGSVGNWSDKYSFETGAPSGGFTFLYLTDTQAETISEFRAWNNSSERAFNAFPDAKFVAVTGDLVERGSSQNHWDSFFYYGSRLLSNMTVVPVIGNHETDSGPHHYTKHFSFPDKNRGPADYIYAFDYGNARFIALSTEKTYAALTSSDENIRKEANQFLDDQIKWLREVVTKDPKKWNIVLIHKAIYTGGWYEYSNECQYYRDKLAPVFDELSIDAVLQGHAHTYDRGFIYKGKTVPGVTGDSVSAVKKNGTVYLTANSAGMKFYDAAPTRPLYLLRNAQPWTQIYMRVAVTDNYMKFDAYSVAVREKDMLYDTFTLYKY